jgi:isopropylmalate/homocitrate/citramalate synthase
MKQTTVEFLVEKLNEIKSSSTDMNGTIKFLEIEFKELFKQAKEIEKQQQGYSEEEVFKIVEQAIKDYNNKHLHSFDGSFSNPIYTNLKEWFEQFKKK